MASGGWSFTTILRTLGAGRGAMRSGRCTSGAGSTVGLVFGPGRKRVVVRCCPVTVVKTSGPRVYWRGPRAQWLRTPHLALSDGRCGGCLAVISNAYYSCGLMGHYVSQTHAFLVWAGAVRATKKKNESDCAGKVGVRPRRRLPSITVFQYEPDTGSLVFKSPEPATSRRTPQYEYSYCRIL